PLALDKLAQIPICSGLIEAEVSKILEISEETSAQKGDFLFQEGDPGDAVYVLLSGSLEILKKDNAGIQQPLACLGAGSAFGEMSLIGNAVRSASAVATSDVQLLRISSARFGHLLAESNPAALKIVYNLAKVMSRRLLLMDEKLVELIRHDQKNEELA